MKYHVKISGKPLPGKRLEEIKPVFAQAFGLSAEQMEQALSGRPKILARAAEEDKAFRLLAKLKAMGLEASLEKIEPLPESVTVTVQERAKEELFSLQPPLAGSAKDAVTSSSMPLADQTVCPKCGEVQGKRTLCQACGLDMPRYHAGQIEAKGVMAAPNEEKVPYRQASRSTANESDFSPVHQHASPLIGLGLHARIGRQDYLTGIPFALVLGGSGLWALATTGQWIWAVISWFLMVWFSIRCSVLRLHDMGRSGWWVLVSVIPFVAFFLSLYLLFGPGEPDENDWGEVPGSLGLGGFFISLFILVAMFFSFGKLFFENPKRIFENINSASFQSRPASLPSRPSLNTEAKPLAIQPFDRNNRVELFVTEDCGERCESLRAWLWRQEFSFNEFHPDKMPSDAQRLDILLKKEGLTQAQLPIVVINGKLHHENLTISLLEQSLKRVPAAN